MTSPDEPVAEPFFEPLPEPPRVEDQPRVYVQMPWQPPVNVLPAWVGGTLVLARTDDTVVALIGFEAYPAGVAYTVKVWLRPGTEPQDDPVGPYVPWVREPRIGWLLEDGTKIGATVEQRPPDDLQSIPDVPRIAGQGGTGGGIHGTSQHWLYPFPGGDRWTVVTEWLARGIPETRVELDARPVRAAAAASAGPLWELPTPPDGAEYGWFGYAG